MANAKGIFQRFLTNFNEGRLAECESMLAADVRFTDAADMSGATTSGSKPVRQWLESWKKAFPNAKMTLVSVVESGDRIATETRGEGTQTGTLQTPQGDIAPTGRNVSMNTVDFVLVKNDKIQDWTSYYNPMELMAQLGLMPGAPASELTKVVEKMYAAFNSGQLDKLESLFASDIRLKDTGGVNVTGPKAVREYLQSWKTAFPDGKLTVKRSVESGSTVVCELVAEGTHSGPLVGPQGELPATKNRVSFGSVDFIVVRDGKISEVNSIYNQAEMMAQLGLTSDSGPEKRNTQAVREAYAAFAKGDVNTILSKLAPNVDWGIEAPMASAVPWHLSFRRREDVHKFFRAIADNIDISRFDAVELVATGNSVASRISFQMTVKKTGKVLSGESTHWFTFNKEGECVRWRGFEDTASQVEAWYAAKPPDYATHAPH